MPPADVAENLMPKSDDDDEDTCFKAMNEDLVAAKEEAKKKAEEEAHLKAETEEKEKEEARLKAEKEAKDKDETPKENGEVQEKADHLLTHHASGEMIHRKFSGTGAGMDVTVSSVKAYIGALYKMLSFKQQQRTSVSVQVAPVQQRTRVSVQDAQFQATTENKCLIIVLFVGSIALCVSVD